MWVWECLFLWIYLLSIKKNVVCGVVGFFFHINAASLLGFETMTFIKWWAVCRRRKPQIVKLDAAYSVSALQMLLKCVREELCRASVQSTSLAFFYFLWKQLSGRENTFVPLFCFKWQRMKKLVDARRLKKWDDAKYSWNNWTNAEESHTADRCFQHDRCFLIICFFVLTRVFSLACSKKLSFFFFNI